MNNFHRPHGGLQEADAPEDAVRSPFSDLAGRFANWMTGADRLPMDETAPAQEPVSRRRRRAAGLVGQRRFHALPAGSVRLQPRRRR